MAIYVGTAGEVRIYEWLSRSWVRFTPEKVTSKVENVEAADELQSSSAIIQLSIISFWTREKKHCTGSYLCNRLKLDQRCVSNPFK